MYCAPCEPLLALIKRDLGGWPTEIVRDSEMHLRLPASAGVILRVRRQRLFMARVESGEFAIAGAALPDAAGRIVARQPGWISRQPVTFLTRRAPSLAPLAAHLNRFSSLRQTLSELDYRRFELIVDAQGWRCAIEPWGASLVVCRLPPLRRYLRLEPHQRMLLLSTLSMIEAAIAQFPPP